MSGAAMALLEARAREELGFQKVSATDLMFGGAAEVGRRFDEPVEVESADELLPSSILARDEMLGEVETEEEPPEGVGGPRSAETERQRPKWGRELPAEVRCSADYRLAVFRYGNDINYALVEMVRDGGGWRERVLLKDEGYSVIEGKLLEMVVENTSP